MTTIQALHSVWNRITGQHLHMGVCSYELEHGWHLFLKAGHTEPELLLVVAYLQGEIRKGERKPGALRWSNCIGNVLRFEEELSLARGALRRKPEPTPRERIVAQFRGTPEPPEKHDAKHVSELINNLKRAAGMPVSQ